MMLSHTGVLFAVFAFCSLKSYFQARSHSESVGGVRGRIAWAREKAASEQ